eukprot:6202198-Pleurochrysis_carterae.AAC.3
MVSPLLSAPPRAGAALPSRACICCTRRCAGSAGRESTRGEGGPAGHSHCSPTSWPCCGVATNCSRLVGLDCMTCLAAITVPALARDCKPDLPLDGPKEVCGVVATGGKRCVSRRAVSIYSRKRPRAAVAACCIASASSALPCVRPFVSIAAQCTRRSGTSPAFSVKPPVSSNDAPVLSGGTAWTGVAGAAESTAGAQCRLPWHGGRDGKLGRLRGTLAGVRTAA